MVRTISRPNSRFPYITGNVPAGISRIQPVPFPSGGPAYYRPARPFPSLAAQPVAPPHPSAPLLPRAVSPCRLHRTPPPTPAGRRSPPPRLFRRRPVAPLLPSSSARRPRPGARAPGRRPPSSALPPSPGRPLLPSSSSRRPSPGARAPSRRPPSSALPPSPGRPPPPQLLLAPAAPRRPRPRPARRPRRHHRHLTLAAAKSHVALLKSGISFPTPGNQLLTAYSGFGSGLATARRVFDEIPLPDAVSWNSLLAAHVSAGAHPDAWRLLRAMHARGLAASTFALSSALRSAAAARRPTLGAHLQSFAVKSGLADSVIPASALVDMYAKCGCLSDARRVFDGMPQWNTFSWNALIAGYSESGNLALKLLLVNLFRCVRVDCFKWLRILIFPFYVTASRS
ncbi:hypothetical protein C2845_PM06G26440 [Panicum miliaceum]|uniref:Pentatricopeptide repeat-containing protein n=1 Tax=Panicum miliaceum TaxID=4540 RepID=A0A3L6R6U5_PANMI|nr:hypothetical protein C2845_PM06G26440 [Panicum miliaceum]